MIEREHAIRTCSIQQHNIHTMYMCVTYWLAAGKQSTRCEEVIATPVRLPSNYTTDVRCYAATDALEWKDGVLSMFP